MFLLVELILYGFLIVFDFSWIKYVGIVLCFCRLLYAGKGYEVLGIIIIADGILLWSDFYVIGIYLFIIVQCYYNVMMRGKFSFYGFLVVIIYPHLYVLACVYALLSLINVILAIYDRHWLIVTLSLLALCDLCVAIQFLTGINIPMIWWFYLPSQIWYTKMVLSNEERTIVKVNSQ